MAERQDTTATGAAERPRDVRNTAGFILMGLSGGHGVFHWLGQSFLVMLPEVKATFGLSPVQIGAIITVRQTTSGLMALPGGILSDIVRRQWGLVLALCMGGFGVGWLVIGVSPVYALLLVGMAIAAVGNSMWHLPAMASLSNHFSQRRGAALSFHGIGGNIGDVIGPVVTGLLLGVLTWRGILGIYAAIPMLLAFVVFWAFRNIGNTETEETAKPSVRGQLQLAKGILKNPILWGVNLVAGLRGMAFVSFTTFLPIYLKDELEMSSGVVGFHIGLLVLVGIIATPAMGYLSDRLGRKPILVPGLLLLATLSLLLVVYGEGAMLTVNIALLGLFLYSDQPILTAAAMDIVGHNVATTTLGVLSFSRFALSAASPIIAGFLYQARGIDTTFQYAAALFALSAIILVTLPLKPAARTS